MAGARRRFEPQGRLKQALKSLAAEAGYDVHQRNQAHPARRAAAMRIRGIDLVLDVGANLGQYAGRLRDGGYHGEIVSFEPLPAAFEVLQAARRDDPAWTGRQCAVGACAGTLEIHERESSMLSSALSSAKDLAKLMGNDVVRTHEVPVVALDDIWEELGASGRRVMLKADTQGYEHQVLDGVAGHLGQLELIEIEMGIASLYSGGSSIYDLLPRLHGAGFDMISLDPGPVDVETGQVMDVDVLLGRRDSSRGLTL